MSKRDFILMFHENTETPFSRPFVRFLTFLFFIFEKDSSSVYVIYDYIWVKK